jgi:hypothetical protein
MKNIPLALVVFEVPPKTHPRDVSRIGIEIQAWHLGTLPLLIDFMHFVPLHAEQMRHLREHFDAGLATEAARFVLKEFGPLNLPLEQYRPYWGDAQDWHFGTVHLLFLVTPDTSIEELQKVLDRNEISRRTP